MLMQTLSWISICVIATSLVSMATVALSST